MPAVSKAPTTHFRPASKSMAPAAIPSQPPHSATSPPLFLLQKSPEGQKATQNRGPLTLLWPPDSIPQHSEFSALLLR